MEKAWGDDLETMSNKKKNLSGERNCLNFRSVNDLIGECVLTRAPTFLLLAGTAPGLSCGCGGRPTILPPALARIN